MADVFISYSKTRGAAAAELAAELGDLGYHVWWDPGLLPTGSFGATIDRELDAAKAVVVIWSPESVRSKWVRSEAEHGDRQDKLVNTHTAEVNDPGRQIPKPFNQTHSVGLDNIRAIVAALDALTVPRSGRKGTPTPLVAPADSVADADDRLFAEVEKANTVAAYTYYLDELPGGRHASVAKFRLHALRPAPTAPPTVPAAPLLPPSPQHEERAPTDEHGEQAADERTKSQHWSPARPALLVAGGVVGVGVVLALAWWGRPMPELTKSPPAVTGVASPAATAVTPPAVTPPATPPAVIPPSATRPQLAEVSGPVLLSPDHERALKPKHMFKECADCPEMVVVPAGSFTMGSPATETGRSSDEGPQRAVTFARPFAVGRFAVTFDEWDACVNDGGCNGYQPADQGWGRGRRPAINVSWDDAKAYVAWLSQKTGKAYRLLSEAEREYVTRAGTATPFWWGNSIATSQANYDGRHTYGDGTKGEYRQQTLPVDAFEPNPWGLFQVHGNVWEWVEDCYNRSYIGAPADGSAWTAGDCSRRVVRGGSWVSQPDVLRAALRRRWYVTDDRKSHVGFRVGRTLTP